MTDQTTITLTDFQLGVLRHALQQYIDSQPAVPASLVAELEQVQQALALGDGLTWRINTVERDLLS